MRVAALLLTTVATFASSLPLATGSPGPRYTVVPPPGVEAQRCDLAEHLRELADAYAHQASRDPLTTSTEDLRRRLTRALACDRTTALDTRAFQAFPLTYLHLYQLHGDGRAEEALGLALPLFRLSTRLQCRSESCGFEQATALRIAAIGLRVVGPGLAAHPRDELRRALDQMEAHGRSPLMIDAIRWRLQQGE